MTKVFRKYQVTIGVEKENGRLQEIADVVVRHYDDALIEAQLWQEKPVAHVIVTSDEKTLRKLIDSLQKDLKVDVDFRVAPHYLYD